MKEKIMTGHLVGFGTVAEMEGYEDYNELGGALVDLDEKYGVYEFELMVEVYDIWIIKSPQNEGYISKIPSNLS